MKIKILIPIYNDWQSVFKLLGNIDKEIVDLEDDISVLIVNDASTEKRPDINLNLKNLKKVEVVNMKENRGHARCNAAGLKYIYENEECNYVIPMDGDGEDRPEEIKNFIEHLNYIPDKPIVGERVKRTESLFFKICYNIHKLLTLCFTGKLIKFGNYTCLPKTAVEQMINEKATWSSFSGSLTKVSKDRATVPSIRGARYFGPSQMSFFNLIKHSLSIIAVFKINVIFRSILFLIIYLFLISESISFITLIPIPFVILIIVSVFLISDLELISFLRFFSILTLDLKYSFCEFEPL